MSSYVISQILVLIASAFIGLSYFSKNKKNIMFLCVAYCIFYSTHYLFLKAYTGMLMSLISAARNIWFYNSAKNNKKNSIFVLIFFASVSLVTGIYSYQDYYSIISMSANILSTYSIWQDDVKIYRLLAIPVSICFLVYAIRINSPIAAIIELILLITEIISILVYNKNNIGSEVYETN